jgi:hypothetical protein
MEGNVDQSRAYECMLEMITAVPIADRRQIMRGAELFFARGWPNNHFTVGMATRAGLGLVPPAYAGIGSEGLYFFDCKESLTRGVMESALPSPNTAEKTSAGRPGRIEAMPNGK